MSANILLFLFILRLLKACVIRSRTCSPSAVELSDAYYITTKPKIWRGGSLPGQKADDGTDIVHSALMQGFNHKGVCS